MPRSNDEKTREFQNKMRTQGAAGFAAGPWKDVEESLGMDQSVVVDQDGNPVWSVRHTRKPRQMISHSAFDRLLGGVAVLAIATLITSALAIYYEQTQGTRISSLFAGSEPASDTDAGNTITLLRPPTAGFIDRPAIEVVENTASDRDIMPGTRETGTPEAARDTLPDRSEAGTGQALAYPESIEATGTAGMATDPASATDRPDTPAEPVAMDEPGAPLPEPPALESSASARNPAAPADALTTVQPDTAEAIETITRQESPAAIAGSTASAGMTDETPVRTAPATAPVTAGQTAMAETMTVIEPAAGPDLARSAAAPVVAAAPGDAPAMPDTGAAVPAAATENPDRPDPPGPVPSAAQRATDTPGANPAPQTRAAVSPAETQDTGTTPQLAQLEPAAPTPSPASAAAAELGETAAVTLDDVPLPGATGRWIINLASYAGPRTANRMQRKFEALGVSTDKQVAEVNGKTMYRLRIASFESRGDAQAYFDTIKDSLGLKSAWITKK